MTAPILRAHIAAGRRHSVGVTARGSVLTTGRPNAEERRVEAWTDVVAVAAGNVHAASNTGRSHTVALRRDGTVLATGWNNEGQCDVEGWSDVVSIAAGWRRTLAIRTDGTALAAGRRNEGANDVAGWSELVAVAAETGTPSGSEPTERPLLGGTTDGGSTRWLNGATSARYLRDTSRRSASHATGGCSPLVT